MSERDALQSPASIPRISVVMPVYNAVRFLEAAVTSILEQTFPDFELICVDDGSTDASLRLLQQLQQRDKRIRIISRPNTGIVRALNDGLAVARGEFVARMDSDDLALPERFKIQVDFLDANPEVVCVGARARCIDVDDDPTGVWRVPLEHAGIESRHIQEGLGGGIIHPVVMIRRQVLMDAGGYHTGTELAEDLDLWLRLAEVGKLANIPAVLLNYRIVSTGLSMSRRVDQERQARTVVNAARTRRGLAPLDTPVEPQIPNEVSQLQRFVLEASYEGYWKSARKYAWRLIKKTPGTYQGWLTFVRAGIHCLLFRQASRAEILRQTSLPGDPPQPRALATAHRG